MPIRRRIETDLSLYFAIYLPDALGTRLVSSPGDLLVLNGPHGSLKQQCIQMPSFDISGRGARNVVMITAKMTLLVVMLMQAEYSLSEIPKSENLQNPEVFQMLT